jgi:hypothetical protein
VLHAPDAAAGFVALGMGARDFVVRNDLVVPIDDVEAAVGAERDGDGTKPFVARLDEIAEQPILKARPVGRDLDRLDFRVIGLATYITSA